MSGFLCIIMGVTFVIIFALIQISAGQCCDGVCALCVRACARASAAVVTVVHVKRV